MKVIIRETADGSHTLYNEAIGDHYHSVNGALMESIHIFILNGMRSISREHLDILEVGYGTGLNALLTFAEAETKKTGVHYTAVEKYPLGIELVEKLNYCNHIGSEYEPVYRLMALSRWDTDVVISDKFTLNKIHCDLAEFKSGRGFDLVYYDAFGPDKQPEMWTVEIISMVAGMINPGGVLVTYSAKGQLKRILKSCGMVVEHLPGPPGKREFTRAIRPGL